MKPAARSLGLFLCAMLAPFGVVVLSGKAAATKAGASPGGRGAAGAAGAAGEAGSGNEIAGGDDSDTSCPEKCDKLTIDDQTKCTDLARGCANDSQQRFDTAKSRLTQVGDGGTGDAERASDYAAAARDLAQRNATLSAAESKLDELKTQYRRAQTWGYGVAAQAHIAGAAGGRGLVGIGLPLTFRAGPMLELVLTPGFDLLRGLPHLAPGTDYQFATARGSLGWVEGDGTSLTLGLGGALRGDFARDSFILAPIALRHRFNNDLGLDLGLRFIAEVSFFVEPWIPLDGSRSTIFFGVGLSIGAGGHSLGKPSDLCLSKADAKALGTSVCCGH